MDYESNKSYIEMRSAGMSLASMVIGIFGVVTSCCIYPAFICGSLAIIFALISRGGEMHTNSYGKAGLILGTIGLILGFLFMLFYIMILLSDMGGTDGYMNYMEDFMEEMEEMEEWEDFDSSDPYDFL